LDGFFDEKPSKNVAFVTFQQGNFAVFAKRYLGLYFLKACVLFGLRKCAKWALAFKKYRPKYRFAKTAKFPCRNATK